ncbi:MAG TPA: 4Fe-4S binding protein [Patescibacteria group bacterium]|nr:4Fe-4S binding protein [Patescibacteria group bacterium]
MPKMLKEVLKNLFSPPATVNYPTVVPEPVLGLRGKITWDMERCDQCQDCERVCPPGAIKVFPDEKKIEYSPFKCMYCHLCIENCMQEAIKAERVYRAPEYEKGVDIFQVEE